MNAPIYRLPPYTVKPVELALSQVIPWSISGYNIPDLWKETKGQGVTVAVIDTGADLTHPDLKDQIADAQDFTGSAYGPQDRQGHGTHVSGTIAAADNDTGVIGVAPSAKLLIAKVLGDDGSGTSTAVAQGIQWAISKGADVISMSLGGHQESPDIDAAVRAAIAAGIVVVCAAGNDGQTNSVNWPGRLSTSLPIITVAAVDNNNVLAPYSSLGPEVVVAAPGTDILSLAPGGGNAILSGTSMATPWCSGTAALYIARCKLLNEPKPTPTQVRAELTKTALDEGPKGQDTGYGWGLIQPSKVIADADSASPGPSQPAMPTLKISGVTLNGVAGSLVFQPGTL